jgi:hypothetical protein
MEQLGHSLFLIQDSEIASLEAFLRTVFIFALIAIGDTEPVGVPRLGPLTVCSKTIVIFLVLTTKMSLTTR